MVPGPFAKRALYKRKFGKHWNSFTFCDAGLHYLWTALLLFLMEFWVYLQAVEDISIVVPVELQRDVLLDDFEV